MAQGLVLGQPLLYSSPARDPRGFLGTLPSPAAPKDDKSRERDPDQVPYFLCLLLQFCLKAKNVNGIFKKLAGERSENCLAV